MSRICPLFFASAVTEIEMECRPDRCAWAYDGGCAITAIAHGLDELSHSVAPDEEYEEDI